MQREDWKSSLADRFTGLAVSSRPYLDDIKTWFDTPLGQHVLNTEAAVLDQLLPGLFGYHLAQFSVQDRVLFNASHIQHKFALHLDDVSDGVVAVPSQLPFADDSLDVTVLHHLLDYVRSPHEVLRELARVTLPMGHLVLIGFNPISFWGLWQGVARFKGRAPWTGSFIRPGRLMDWLNLLNFKIDRAQYAIYRPPSARFPGRITDYSHGVSRNLNLPIGSVYVIVARKHVGGITPIRPVWQSRPALGRLTAVQTVRHDSLKKGLHVVTPKGKDPE